MPETPKELLARLAAGPNSPYPAEIVAEIITRYDEMKEELLVVVEEAAVEPAKYINGFGLWKPLTFAAFVLAQFREKRAFQPLCASLNLPADLADRLWGDMITGDMGSILASVYDGNEALLREIAGNPDANEYVRGATIPAAYASLLNAGIISRDEVESAAGELLARLERMPSYAWDGWACFCADLGFTKLLPLLESAHRAGLLDPWVSRFDELVKDIRSGGHPAWNRRAKLIEDTIAETKWWHSWKQEDDVDGQDHVSDEDDSSVHGFLDAPQPPAVSTKIGRNDPCPCGSGRKYKKCCGAL